jgi:serine/threonine protein kinase
VPSLEWNLPGGIMEYSDKLTTRTFSTNIRRIRKIPALGYQIGIFRMVTIGYIYFFEPQLMKVIPMYASLVKRTLLIWKMLNVKRDLAYWGSRKSEIISKNDDITDISDFGLNEIGQKLLKEKLKTTNQVVIAEIDQSGFFLSHFGQIDGIPCVDEANFIPREQCCLDLVTIDGKVGVKKHYNGSVISFIREIEALYALSMAGCNVPSILDVDFENCTLTISYIPGNALREHLSEIRTLKKIDGGQENLRGKVSQDFIEKLFDQIIKIHSAGFILDDINYEEVIIEKKTGNPYLINFESSNNFTGTGSRVFRQLRDYDIQKFNIHFETDKPTYRVLKRKIKNQEFPSPETWYSGVYISSGLRIGAPLWTVNTGWGRWHFILKNNLPNLIGKRVLDLGANNGFVSLQILKGGAREAVGLEINPIYIQQGNFLKSAMEWSDNQKYNFRYVQSSMVELKSMDLGHFDLVLALCSIYYLEDYEITGLVRDISTLTDCFIVQCNTERDIGREDLHTYEKASVEYLKKALEENGFNHVKLVAPKNYSHPLLIGRK